MPSILLDIISYWGIRDPFSMLSHLLGAVLGLIATIFLVHRARKNGLKGQAVAVYGITVVLAFSASALFHYVDESAARLTMFKKIDHAAIFLMMAGTGTAIYGTLGARWAEKLIAATWATCIIALAIKLLVWPMALWATASIYLTVGWVSSMGLFTVISALDWQRLRLYLIGAAVLTVGAIVFATHWPVLWPGVIEGHEVFHVLVLIGVGFHVRFVYLYCTCPEALSASTLDTPEAPLPDLGLEA